MTITEADIFFTNHPLSLIEKYSPEQLEVWFGPSNRLTENIKEYQVQLLNDIWQKYCRVDLIKWDPVHDAIFFDYCSQRFLSLSQFEENFEKYSIMSLRRLYNQLMISYERWKLEKTAFELEPFNILIDKIYIKLQRVMLDYVVVNNF